MRQAPDRVSSAASSRHQVSFLLNVIFGKRYELRLPSHSCISTNDSFEPMQLVELCFTLEIAIVAPSAKTLGQKKRKKEKT